MDDWGPVAFADVAEGQWLKFVTMENGFNGRGMVIREGRVTAATEKTVRIACLDDSRAVLRRDDWGARAVLRTSREEDCHCPGGRSDIYAGSHRRHCKPQEGTTAMQNAESLARDIRDDEK
jgi:hypothetical protein